MAKRKTFERTLTGLSCDICECGGGRIGYRFATREDWLEHVRGKKHKAALARETKPRKRK